MGPFWSAIVAAFVAAHPGAELNEFTQGGEIGFPYMCGIEVYGGGVYAEGYSDVLPDRWNPEPLTDTCDRAALEAMTFACTWFEDPENPPAYCEF